MDGIILIVWLLMTVAWADPNIKASGKWLVSSVIGMIIGAVIGGLILYFFMPPLIPIVIAALFFVMLWVNCLLRYFIEDSMVSNTTAITLVISFIAIIAIVLGAIFTPALYAKELHRIPNVVAVDGTTDMISLEHIRVVPYKTALWKADKKVGELGYKLEVQEPHIQFRGGELKWLVPLEYNGLYRSWKFRHEGTEGYIIVSAEEPRDEPGRILNLHLRYIPSGVFSHKLKRHIYLEYPDYFQKESVFQLNDQGKPIYVTMLTRPTILGITGEKPAGIIVTDPQRGTKSFYDMEHIPDYIQRVVDESLTEKYLKWWGKYVGGFWNSLPWAQRKNVKEPTGGISSYNTEGGETKIDQGSPDIYLVCGKDGKLYWFSAITTPGEDTSMVGYILTDVKSWPLSFEFYSTEGFFNDIGAAQNIQQDPDVSKVMGFKVAQPIMYIMEGNEVWIAPVLSSQNEVKEFGVVQAKGGATFVSETLSGAIAEYKASLGISIEISEEGITEKELIKEIQILLSQANEKLEKLAIIETS